MSDIIHDLHYLKGLHASDNLHGRIQEMKDSLSARETLPVFPFFYATRIVLAVLLLFVFLGSGVVLAAYTSKPGGALFPVKKAIVQAQLQFVKDPVAREQLQKEIEAPTPTPLLPTPTEKLEPTKGMEGKPSIQEPHEDLKHAGTGSLLENNSDKNTSPSAVLGTQTKKEEGKDHLKLFFITPIPSISLLPKTDNED